MWPFSRALPAVGVWLLYGVKTGSRGWGTICGTKHKTQYAEMLVLCRLEMNPVPGEVSVWTTDVL